MYQHNLLFLNSCIKNVCQVVKIARAVEECEAWRPSPRTRTATRPSRLTILRSFLLSWKSFCTLICLCLYCLFTPIKCEAWWPSPPTRTATRPTRLTIPGSFLRFWKSLCTLICLCLKILFLLFLYCYLPLPFSSLWSNVKHGDLLLAPALCPTRLLILWSFVFVFSFCIFMWSMVTFPSRTLTWPTQDPFPQICGTQQPLLTGC